MPKSHKITISDYANANADFEELHKRGAERFEALWLWANQKVIRDAREFGIDISDTAVKSMLSRMAWSMLVLCEGQIKYLETLMLRKENKDVQPDAE